MNTLPPEARGKGKGGKALAHWMNRVRAWMRAFPDLFTAEPPLEVRRGPRGIHFSLARDTVVERFELQSHLWRGTSAQAFTLVWDGATSRWRRRHEEADATIHADFITGFHWSRQQLSAVRSASAGRWLALDAGASYCTGTLIEDLDLEAPLLTDRQEVDAAKPLTNEEKTITVHNIYGTAKRNDRVGCLWNEPMHRWEAALQECPN